jgi:hypothetical protein
MAAFEPVDLPVVLTASKSLETRKAIKEAGDNDALPASVREMLKTISAADEDEQSAPLTLYVNANSRIVQTLRDSDLRHEATQLALSGLYNNAVMMSQHLQTADNAKIIAATANRVLQEFVEQGMKLQAHARDLAKLRRESRKTSRQKSGHVTCFVALPFDDQYETLMQAIKERFEGHPYFWEVLRADKNYAADSRVDVEGHIRSHMDRAHVFLAEVSEANPNVMIEVGRMQMMEGIPLYYLQWREGAAKIADIDGKLVVKYPREDPARVIAELDKFQMLQGIKAGERYLAIERLQRHPDWGDLETATQQYIQRRFQTLEAVLGQPQPPSEASISKAEWKLFLGLVNDIAAGREAG